VIGRAGFSVVIYDAKQADAEPLKEIISEPEETISWPRSETG